MNRILNTSSHFEEHSSPLDLNSSTLLKGVYTCNSRPFLERCSTGHGGASIALHAFKNEDKSECFSLELHFGSSYTEPVFEIHNEHSGIPFEVDFRAAMVQGVTIFGEIRSKLDLDHKNAKIVFTGWNRASQSLDPNSDLVLVIAMKLTMRDFIDHFALGRKHTEIYKRKYIEGEDLSPASSTKQSSEGSDSVASSGLASDLTEELTSGDMADAKVISGSSEFPVNTVILSTRSHVMKTMFRSDMIERKTKILDLTDLCLPDNVIWSFLVYCYSAAIMEDSNLALHLLKMGDLYQVRGLKEKCEEILQNSLEIHNCASIFSTSLMHCGEKSQLCQASMKLLTFNFLSVTNNEDWREVRNSKEVLKILRKSEDPEVRYYFNNY